jgi:CRISPR-associated protein Csd1
MTILQSLVQRYDRLALTGDVPVPGFTPSQISFSIVLNRAGRLVTTLDERVGEGKKRRPKLWPAPAAPKRTVGIASGAFWDKTSYVLGRTAVDTAASPAKQAKDAVRLDKEHAAFLARHETLLTDSEDPGCIALLAFLRQWAPADFDALPHAEAMLDQNIAFRLDDERGFIHDSPAARAALIAEAAALDAGLEAMCLVTGRVASIARLHPSIKNVPGAQSSGAALVSFNLESFTSYGRSQGANAPVSEAAAFAYGSALNSLLSPTGLTPKGRPNYRNRVMLGETAVVFWAEHGHVEDITRALLDAEEEVSPDGEIPVDEAGETNKLRETLRQMQDGTPLLMAPDMHPASHVYILGLSPNAARLSVRFWVDQTFADFARHFQLHWADLSLEPKPRAWPPPLWRLLLELAPQRKAENIPPHLSG